ncbi:MAG: hypothetical protein IPI91_02555 [Flavobacteriales bacterium]|nr:hypothetical protein [Flavobacteriales bacterium]
MNATTGTGFQYVWYRDGSVISGATNGSYTATQAGAYTVRVISGACYTNSSAITVSITTSGTAGITPVGSTSFCTGGNVVLNASTGSSYQWKKDGNAISGATSSSYTATTSGTYTVTVSNGSCSATSSGVSVSASSGPSANITAPNGTTFCSGGSAILNATTGTGFHVWYRDGSVISGATNGSYTATQAGAYTVRVISGACYTNSSAITVSITTSGTASITPVGSTSFCTGGNVVLNASTGSSYQWKKDGNAISGATSSSYTATTSGTYTVTVSNGSCSATSSGVSVSASSGPSANITAPNGTTFCSGGSAILNATTGTGFQYVWYRDGSVISGATNGSYTATQAGAYTVRVIGWSMLLNSSAITVSITTSGTASITPVGSTSFCTGGNVVLNASTKLFLPMEEGWQHHQWCNQQLYRNHFGNVHGNSKQRFMFCDIQRCWRECIQWPKCQHHRS